MRSRPAVSTVAAGVGLVLIAEAAHRTGTVPLGRPTDGWQVVVGAGFLAIAAGPAIIMATRRGRMKALLVLVIGAAVVVLAMPYLEWALFGPDPGFVLRTFETFEWSPVARFVLLPALREVGALLALAAGVGLALHVARPVIGPAQL